MKQRTVWRSPHARPEPPKKAPGDDLVWRRLRKVGLLMTVFVSIPIALLWVWLWSIT